MTDTEQDLPPEAPCSPCRGTGKVISNLGGIQAEGDCPWCDGTGIKIPGVDAQEHWRADSGSSP